MAKKLKTQNSDIVNKLGVISRLCDKDGLAYEKHALFKSGFIFTVSSVGLSSAVVCEYPEGFEGFAPNVAQLSAALSRFNPEKVVQQNNNTLRINSGQFRATIECLPEILNFQNYPDSPLIECPVDFLKTLSRCAKIAETCKGDAHRFKGVNLANGCATGTNGRVILQVYHGLAIPPLTLPVEFCEAARAFAGQPATIGYSPHSFTLHFSDGSWLRTGLLQAKYPDVEPILIYDESDLEFPAINFFEALGTVEPFLDRDEFFLSESKLSSSLVEESETSYTLHESTHLETCGQTFCFKSDYFRLIENEIKTYYIDDGQCRFYFFGEMSRGCMVGIKTNVN